MLAFDGKKRENARYNLVKDIHSWWKRGYSKRYQSHKNLILQNHYDEIGIRFETCFLFLSCAERKDEAEGNHWRAIKYGEYLIL